MLLGINIKLVWLAVAVIFGIGEMFTAGLTLIWFSFGVSNTNIDALIGKYAIVEKDVSNIAYGIVNLEGEKWTAVSEKEVTYKKGEKVKVVRIDGVKLVVTK